LWLRIASHCAKLFHHDKEKSCSGSTGPKGRPGKGKEPDCRATQQIGPQSRQGSLVEEAMTAAALTCQKEGCPRKGQQIRLNTTRSLRVRGSRKTLLIRVYLCEDYRHRRTLHTQLAGPHDEKLEKLGFAHYRFQDAATGRIIETQRAPGNRKFSEQGLANIRAARREFWSDPQKREQACKRMSQAIISAWADPIKRQRMTDASRRKAADPNYRKRMSIAQRRALKDPEKRRRRSEGARQARLRERALLRKYRATPRAKRGRKPGMAPDTKARIILAATLSLKGQTYYAMAPTLYPRQHRSNLAYKSTKELFRCYRKEIEAEKVRLRTAAQ